MNKKSNYASYYRGDSNALYIIDECWSSYPNAIPLRRNSRLTQPLNHVLTVLVESGLLQKWNRDELSRGKPRSPEDRLNEVMSLTFGDVYVQMIAWVLGMTASGLTYILERWFHSASKESAITRVFSLRPHPNSRIL